MISVKHLFLGTSHVHKRTRFALPIGSPQRVGEAAVIHAEISRNWAES